MTSRPHSRPRPGQLLVDKCLTFLRRWWKRLAIILLCLCMGALLFMPGLYFTERVQSRLEQLTLNVTTPALSLLSFLSRSTYDSLHFVKDILYVHSENGRLRQENMRLIQNYAELKQTQLENEELRRLMRYAAAPSSSYLTARIAGITEGPLSHVVTLTSGELEGVERGQVVMNSYGLIGRVTAVGRHSAHVLLITDTRSRIPVTILHSRERGVLAGNNTPLPQLFYLPEDAKVEVGELVFTSGDGMFLPAGILVGAVCSVKQGVIKVQPSVRWSQMDYVKVVSY
jgi:rod shape-determining protein MreC